MKIAVSSCLLVDNCKYNGGNNYSEKVMKFVEKHEVISVCPEVLGGLPIPRESAEIVNGVVSLKDGSFSGKLIPGQGVFSELLKKNGIKVIDVEDL